LDRATQRHAACFLDATQSLGVCTIPLTIPTLWGRTFFGSNIITCLKNGTLSATPWLHGFGVRGMQDVAAIVADIAVIDPRSRAPLTDAQLTTLTTPGMRTF